MVCWLAALRLVGHGLRCQEKDLASLLALVAQPSVDLLPRLLTAQLQLPTFFLWIYGCFVTPLPAPKAVSQEDYGPIFEAGWRISFSDFCIYRSICSLNEAGYSNELFYFVFCCVILGPWELAAGDDATALTCLLFPTATPRVPGIRIKATMRRQLHWRAGTSRRWKLQSSRAGVARRDQRTCKNACPME